jgi:hypothetical protein
VQRETTLASTTPKKKLVDPSTFYETIVGAVLGAVLYFLHKEDAAAMSALIGSAFSANRFLLSRQIDEQLGLVRALARRSDLEENVNLKDLQNLITEYYAIPEEEFRLAKESVVSDAIARLQQLAHQKRSDELSTGTYYTWLLPMIEHAPKGSRIWAISMMLTIEWDDSPSERRFLELNMAAAKRGVHLERVFILTREGLPELLNNPGVKAHAESPGTITPLVVFREELTTRDPMLLKNIGDGFIAFDHKVALVDMSAEDGMRGYVTMNSIEITRLKVQFDSLKVLGHDLRQLYAALPATATNPALPGSKRNTKEGSSATESAPDQG